MIGMMERMVERMMERFSDRNDGNKGLVIRMIE